MPLPSSSIANTGSGSDRARILTFFAPAATELSNTSATAISNVYPTSRREEMKFPRIGLTISVFIQHPDNFAGDSFDERHNNAVSTLTILVCSRYLRM